MEEVSGLEAAHGAVDVLDGKGKYSGHFDGVFCRGVVTVMMFAVLAAEANSTGVGSLFGIGAYLTSTAAAMTAGEFATVAAGVVIVRGRLVFGGGDVRPNARSMRNDKHFNQISPDKLMELIDVVFVFFVLEAEVNVFIMRWWQKSGVGRER